MTPWPHQQSGFEDVLSAVARGERRILLTSPTGGGKTRIMEMLIQHYLDAGRKAALYTNRKLLVEQTSRVLEAAGLAHGVRSAGHDDERWHDLQVSSIQTEHSRVMKKQKWGLHDAELVLVDEAHLQTGPTTKAILDAHHKAGAAIVGFTATPIGLAGLYDHLVAAGTTSELRECGALVPAHHFGPDEPDLRAFKKLQEGEDLTEGQNRKAIMTPSIFGRVWEWFEKLNPEHKPTILFAPGVRESIWFAEQFTKKGVPAAHIDGQEVWVNGKLERSSREARQDVIGASEGQRITVLCNRFVLREGIDCPWLAHGIFATVFGALQSYLQSGGRLLRAHPSLANVIIQDHGGNWWRHGSLNADRGWFLGMTPQIAVGLRADRLRAKLEREPFRCPKCGMILSRRICPTCGHEVLYHKKSRPVISTDGTLKELSGDIFRPHRICQRFDGKARWTQMYYRSRTEKGARTFRAAAALFAYENNWGWPDPTWPLMPTTALDWYLNVADVPRERLTS